MILFNVISISYIENDVLFFYLELLHKDFFKSDPRAKKNKIKKKDLLEERRSLTQRSTPHSQRSMLGSSWSSPLSPGH